MQRPFHYVFIFLRRADSIKTTFKAALWPTQSPMQWVQVKADGAWR